VLSKSQKAALVKAYSLALSDACDKCREQLNANNDIALRISSSSIVFGKPMGGQIETSVRLEVASAMLQSRRPISFAQDRLSMSGE